MPFRLFYARSRHGACARSIADAFFNPLIALEFRPEFDRITSPQVLELIQQRARASRRTGSSRSRSSRSSACCATSRCSTRIARRARASAVAGGRAYLVLSVLRSDARALTDYLRQRAGALLAESFERDLLRVPAPRASRARYDELARRGPPPRRHQGRARGHRRQPAARDAPRASSTICPPADARDAERELRAARVRQRDREPAPRAAERDPLPRQVARRRRSRRRGVFDDAGRAPRAPSERLRRDVWMFAQIVRAFASKARARRPDRRSLERPSYASQFVREFLAYFRAMGYPLLRAGDYPRFDAFMAAMTALEETDLARSRAPRSAPSPSARPSTSS